MPGKFDPNNLEDVELDNVDDNEGEDTPADRGDDAPADKAPVKDKKPAAKDAPAEDEDEGAEDDAEDGAEDEDDAEDAEDGEDGADDDKPPAKADRKVPLKVLDKANEKRRKAEERAAALEAELEELRAQQTDKQNKSAEKLQQEIDELYEKVELARAEGDAATAAKLQKQLDQHNRNLTTAQATYIATQRAIKDQQNLAYDAALDKLVILDPRFDSNSADADEDMIVEALEYKEAFEAKGYSPADALRRAVKAVAGEDLLAPGRKTAAKAAEPAKKPEPRKPDVKRNIDAAKKTPPAVGGGKQERPETLDISQLEDEEFAALPKSRLAKLRGDFIV